LSSETFITISENSILSKDNRTQFFETVILIKNFSIRDDKSIVAIDRELVRESIASLLREASLT